MRVKAGITRRRRHKKVLERASGYYSANSRQYKIAVEKNDRALVYAYRDRRVKKREMRRLWIIRINAAARLNGTTYSALMNGLKSKGIELDRKTLAELAVNDPNGFANVVQQAAK